MTLARIAVSLVGLTAALAISCSDPPSPPAQGALTIIVQPSGGGSCLSHAQLTAPTEFDVYKNLTCNVADESCQPNDLVVVDGADGVDLDCTVASEGDGYKLAGTLRLPGIVDFGVASNSPLREGANAGGLQVFEWASATGESQSDPACDVTIRKIQGGAVLADFFCSALGKQTSASDPACTARGSFIFENCGG